MKRQSKAPWLRPRQADRVDSFIQGQPGAETAELAGPAQARLGAGRGFLQTPSPRAGRAGTSGGF